MIILTSTYIHYYLDPNRQATIVISTRRIRGAGITRRSGFNIYVILMAQVDSLCSSLALLPVHSNWSLSCVDIR